MDSSPAKRGTLRRQFIVYYVGFALVPFALLFFLFTQYGVGSHVIGVSRENLGVMILLAGVVSLIGFVATRAMLTKVMRLSSSVRDSLAGQADKRFITAMMSEEGEVAELAKSFNAIISQLETNIQELEATKARLHHVLTKVGTALASMEDLSSLVRLVLETAMDAFGARDGAVLLFDTAGKAKIETLVAAGDPGAAAVCELLRAPLDIIRADRRVMALQGLPHERDNATPFAKPLLCAPLISHDILWGAICIGGRSAGRDYSAEEISIISNLGAQIAISIENWRLSKDKERIYFETISALALAVEARDPYSRGHSERVSQLAVKTGEAMHLEPDALQALRDASRLHDIGKIGVVDSILRKNGPLTTEELDQMRRHPVIGESIVMPLKSFGHLLDPIRHHHERLDGSGYPDGLHGDQISLTTRIISVADMYDALTTERPYRSAMSWDDTVKLFRHEAAAGRLDSDVIDTFLAVVERREGAVAAAQT